MAGNAIALAINGRFLAQPVSGVQRYGRQLIQALDSVLMRAERRPFRPLRSGCRPTSRRRRCRPDCRC